MTLLGAETIELDACLRAHHVELFDQDSLAVFVDLGDLIDLSSIPTAHNTDSVSRSEENVLAAKVVGNLGGGCIVWPSIVP